MHASPFQQIECFHPFFLLFLIVCINRLTIKQTTPFVPVVYSGAAQVKLFRVLPQASGSSPMLPEGSATSTSIAKEKSSRGKTMVRTVKRYEKGTTSQRRDVYRRGKLPPRTNGGTLTSTEACECSNATNVSSRSTTRFASAVVTRTPKPQKGAARKERSEYMC
jgi:hypothetical protein